MIPYQKIGEIKIYVNSRNPVYSDFTDAEREVLANEFKNIYEKYISGYNEKDIVMIECLFSKSSDLTFTLTILVRYSSLYQNTTEYYNIYNRMYEFVESINSSYLSLNENEKFLMALQSMNVAPPKIAIKLFEKAEADLIKEKNDNKYILFDSEDNLCDFFNEKLKDNFFFVNSHRLTNIHEIDVKLAESRYSLALGLTQSSIAMLCVTLEEFLKSLLKYKLVKSMLATSKEKPNLGEISRISKAAQKKYGSETLGPIIKLAKEKKIITDEEEIKFNDLKTLRDGYLHSDKSKIFSKTKVPVHLVSMENNSIKVVETKNMSMDELIFAQGISQKNISDREAKFIFFEIEDYIFRVCERFWKDHYN